MVGPLSASISRDQPKIITIRNFNKFNERNFQNDIARTPFQVCEVFDDPTDVYYSWNLLFTQQEDARRRLRGMCGFKKELRVCWMEMEVV